MKIKEIGTTSVRMFTVRKNKFFLHKIKKNKVKIYQMSEKTVDRVHEMELPSEDDCCKA